MTDPIRTYLKNIEGELKAGRATENTHRPALEALIETLVPGAIATNEPKRIECGAPDFIITRDGTPLGYVEAKDIGANLNAVERSEQLERYLGALNNLLLTDYLEFRWYVNGEHRETVQLATVTHDGQVKRIRGAVQKATDLFELFSAQQVPMVGQPGELAERMAALSRMIRDLIRETFERESEKGTLHAQLEAFRKTMIPNLEPAAFADMYAQTITYGLFAARVRTPDGRPFTRENAAWNLPPTNPFLRKLFNEIAGPDLDDRIAWLVDDLANLLARADMSEVLLDFGQSTRREDPVVHFYETFLVAYDPQMRQTRGVYYTPEPVVSYIVRSIDHILKNDFNRPLGLADMNTLILDPAVGTATFLYFVIQHINETLVGMGLAGGWNDYVEKHLLPRLFGFELLMAPYAVAHMKLGIQLQETGYMFASDQRLGIYLTNTLETAVTRAQTLGFAGYITAEANAAAEVKRDKPIMVVLGNPPYSGHSANSSWQTRSDGKRVLNFIGKLLQDYYQVDGHKLREKNTKWLQDDYVKFIRWGQWRIEKTGVGVLAFISNHGYLDNPTFRGMRQQLMQAFTDIYILDLHGNAKKKETAPDGSKDENVFDIQQGVAIGIFVKDPTKSSPATVHHAELWGLRQEKYRQLFETDVATTPWERLEPQSLSYLFVPQDRELWDEYQKGSKVTEIFPVHSVGIVTARDRLTIRWTPEEAWSSVQDFGDLSVEAARAKYSLGRDVRDWKVHLAQDDIRASGPDQAKIVPVLYRPFDVRFTYYTGRSRGFICMPRPKVMQQMAHTNISIVLPRRVEVAGPWKHVTVTNHVLEHVAVSLKTIDSLYPLYLYPSGEGGNEKDVQSRLPHTTTWSVGKCCREPNLGLQFVANVSSRLGLQFVPDGKGDLETTFGPEDILHYAYAVFHSPTYRGRYAEFLRIDYPRLPLTSDLGLFRTLAAKGEELVALHLMESPRLAQLITRFPETGSNDVEQLRYVEPHQDEHGGPVPGRVYINKTQYFEGVPPEVWNFYVGGYQVCQKWLKDRKKRKLSFDDLLHYQKIVVALKETIRLMSEIDEAIPSWPIE